MFTGNNDARVLKYGMGSKGWGPLFPAKQSSLYAALIISHVYDSLVGVDNQGGFVPNLAKTWDISDDYTVYTFVLDTDRRFSDGTRLTAQIYKDSLLDSIALEAAAVNKSALDVLYALKGFAEFEFTGNISGLEVEGDSILRMRFERPYRRAIDQLSGTRYGAYIIRDGQYLGAGPYKYKMIGEDIVELDVNPYHLPPPSIKRVKITSQGIDDLYKGVIDVALPPLSTSVRQGGHVTVNSEQLSSLLITHWIVIVNGMPGRILSDHNLRKAAQFVIYNYFMNNYSDIEKLPYFTPDPQFYPSLFLGRLPHDEAVGIINEGSVYVDQLRIASRTNPIICLHRSNNTFNYCEALKQHGIETISQPSSFPRIQEVMNKTFDADLATLSVSHANADPDGIYHFLGRNGAIWSPLSSRPAVESLIENGRSIIDRCLIDEHYKQVSRTILEEVPAIHLGSQNLYLEFNADLVSPVKRITGKRKAINATLFRWHR